MHLFADNDQKKESIKQKVTKEQLLHTAARKIAEKE